MMSRVQFEVVDYLERIAEGWSPTSAFNYPERELRHAMHALSVVRWKSFYKGVLTRWVYLGPGGIERRYWACDPSEAADAILSVGDPP